MARSTVAYHPPVTVPGAPVSEAAQERRFPPNLGRARPGRTLNLVRSAIRDARLDPSVETLAAAKSYAPFAAARLRAVSVTLASSRFRSRSRLFARSSAASTVSTFMLIRWQVV